MSKPLIEVKNVSVARRGQIILEDVSLHLKRGDFYAIIGPNGGGKTTLLQVILGLERPKSGSVSLFGRPPSETRGRLGYVPQFRTFDFEYPLTVREMVISGRLGHIAGPFRKYGPEDREKAEKALATMGISELASRPVHALSGGEQQRAIIARALVGEPEVILLDEPTVYVDTPTEDQFFDILDHLRRTMTILLVTHDIGVVSAHVTRIACLNRRLFTHDTPEITPDMIEGAYHCPVDLIAHGVPHRVFEPHEKE